MHKNENQFSSVDSQELIAVQGGIILEDVSAS
jgi:hypothetical protein